MFAERALQADAAALRQALGLPFDEEDPELYYEYPIHTEQQLESLQPFLEHPVAFQPERFDYILECFQGTDKASTGGPPAEGAPPPVERVLGIYRKAHGDELLFEYELPSADVELRKLLGPPDDQNLFRQRVFRTSWRITTRELAEQLRPYLKVPIDPEGDVDYLVEYHDPKRTRRMLFAYAKGERAQGRSAVAGHELRGMTKRDLRKLFGLAEDHPGTGSHPVATKEQAQALTRFLDFTPDLEAQDYAVEYYGLPVQMGFVVLPYVTLRSTPVLPIGEYELWPNTRESWFKMLGTDGTGFTTMYRNAQGYPVRENGSVLTRRDLEPMKLEEARDVVMGLSTLAWLRGHRGADAWVFDVFRFDHPGQDLKEEHFLRESKHSINLTTAEFDRIYPLPYGGHSELDSYSIEALIPFIAAELGKPPRESLVRAMHYFHRARLETPYLSLEGDDIDALWTGFEAMFRVGPEVRQREEHVWAELEKLLPAIGLVLREEAQQGLREGLRQMYQTRNAYAHGNPELPVVRLEKYGRHVYAVGLILAECILQAMAQDNSLLRAHWSERLDHLFIEKPFTDEFIRLLKNSVRTDWYPATNATQQSRVERLDSLLGELLRIERILPDYKGNLGVAKARKKMGLVLSEWCKALLLTQPLPQHLHELCAVVVGEIQTGSEKKQSDDEIDSAVVRQLIEHEAHHEATYELAGTTPALRLFGRLSFCRWVCGFIRLEELYRDRPLMRRRAGSTRSRRAKSSRRGPSIPS